VFVRNGMGAWSQQAYVKAFNTGADDNFGQSVALSGDGNTLAVGAHNEDSNAVGIDGDQANDLSTNSGAVYVYGRDGMGAWSQQAYVKASNTGNGDLFGQSVALSGDGNTLAVGAYNEDSNAVGIDGNQASNLSTNSGAAYVLVRDGMGAWSHQAYVKASNTGVADFFGYHVALADEGNVLGVAAFFEDSDAIGIDGDQANNNTLTAGAAYVFVRDGAGAWSHRAYVKASNTDVEDFFGRGGMALSGDGSTLAVTSHVEDSNAVGIDGDQANDLAPSSGAVYLY
jgi:CO dehydrogenase/acetyl-CoA synthase epsilon subunit